MLFAAELIFRNEIAVWRRGGVGWRRLAAGTGCFVSSKMSVSKQRKGLCAWNEEKHFTVQGWRLLAGFTWRNETVASASFWKFPTVICKLRWHSFFFFSPSGLHSDCSLEGDSVEHRFCTKADPFRILTAQWNTPREIERRFLPCFAVFCSGWSRGSWGQKGLDCRLSCLACCLVGLQADTSSRQTLHPAGCRSSHYT